MLSFPKHESYQSTEEDWLGDIPKHWQLLRTKSIFRLVAEPAPKNNNEELLSVYSDIGVKPRRELEERGNKASTTDGYWLVKKGDIIVNKLLAWMGAIGLSEYDGVTSPAYDILRDYKPINSKFYHYLFRNPICINKLKKHSKGIVEMHLRLYFDEFGNIKIPYPPLEDQNRIVEFLDQKTAEIDQVIEQKQRLIKLLKEQKAILIDRAVTKGLNPNVPMRDSGVKCLGKIPDFWKSKRLKFSVKKICDCKNRTPEYFENGEYFVVWTSNTMPTVQRLTQLLPIANQKKITT
jgi:type I restriction enzyme, S subunit